MFNTVSKLVLVSFLSLTSIEYASASAFSDAGTENESLVATARTAGVSDEVINEIMTKAPTALQEPLLIAISSEGSADYAISTIFKNHLKHLTATAERNDDNRLLLGGVERAWATLTRIKSKEQCGVPYTSEDVFPSKKWSNTPKTMIRLVTNAYAEHVKKFADPTSQADQVQAARKWQDAVNADAEQTALAREKLFLDRGVMIYAARFSYDEEKSAYIPTGFPVHRAGIISAQEAATQSYRAAQQAAQAIETARAALRR